ncbi:ThiF family adenylyltransferase [Sporosarcina sp. ANT_H38]|uniref:HesA/MoeB/ThiF family protein n=1 Tax=unclassified Sporosarcina TaxID=2647733 RepID=UPI0011F0AEDF|nr:MULTISPECIES: ThiF family adenylyltransferase [unclassified Sporosarcina]KAA0940629.1 ThiF family adenylyltransferase [Sporosarcina sp. ANT_H38]QJS06565.1 thiamine biosynthesis protein ThiF, UBA/THIF-type NAD/FAD binding protein [Sporosarcina sp.]
MKYPKIKEIHGILYLNNRIRIGSGFGYAMEIDDPENKYASLIELLNGENSIDDILKKLNNENLTAEEIIEGINSLNSEGYLEDASTEPPAILSKEELERYKVNINFFNTLSKESESKYDYQVKLKNSHVVIFGMGGIGSNICMALIELGIGKITAVDFDTVELSNLNRQLLYSTSSVGKLKTDEARKRINDFNPEIDFKAINKKISSSDEVKKILDENPCDVVVNVADFPSGYIDFWVNEACVNKNIPIFAGVVQKRFGRVYSVLPGETACYNCQYIQETNTAPGILEEFNAMQKNMYRTPNGALGPTCLFHGYFISYEIMRYLLNIDKILTYNKLFEIDFLTFESRYYDIEKNANCDVCNKVKVKL